MICDSEVDFCKSVWKFCRLLIKVIISKLSKVNLLLTMIRYFWTFLLLCGSVALLKLSLVLACIKFLCGVGLWFFHPDVFQRLVFSWLSWTETLLCFGVREEEKRNVRFFSFYLTKKLGSCFTSQLRIECPNRKNWKKDFFPRPLLHKDCQECIFYMSINQQKFYLPKKICISMKCVMWNWIIRRDIKRIGCKIYTKCKNIAILITIALFT